MTAIYDSSMSKIHKTTRGDRCQTTIIYRRASILFIDRRVSIQYVVYEIGKRAKIPAYEFYTVYKTPALSENDQKGSSRLVSVAFLTERKCV